MCNKYVTFFYISIKYILTMIYVLGCICWSKEEELDLYIFKIFDICDKNNGLINKNEMMMMLNNLPDMGFSNFYNLDSQNKIYNDIKCMVVKNINM
jgi:hypothetical protein